MSTITYDHTYTAPGTYTVTVTDATGATATATVTVNGPALPAPGNTRLLPLGPDGDGAKLSAAWNPVEGNSGYRLRIRKASETTWGPVIDVAKDVTFYDVGSLQAGTDYQMQVQAVGAPPVSQDSAWSAIGTGTTLPGIALAPPTGVAATGPAGGTTLSVAWTSGGGYLTGYEMRWAPTGTTNWTTVAAAASPGTITGLTAATTYDVQVRAKGDGNAWLDSDWTATVQGTTAAS